MKHSLVVSSFLPFLINFAYPQQQTFTNPILDRNSADPAVIRLEGFYYLTLSENSATELTIYKSPILTSFRNAEEKVIYRAPDGYDELWASEPHIVDGELYIYFTMRVNAVNDHRMFVIKAENASNPMGNWSDAKRSYKTLIISIHSNNRIKSVSNSFHHFWKYLD